MTLSDEERQKLVEQFKTEFAEQYRKQAETGGHRRSGRELAKTADEELARQAEIAQIKHDALEAFHKENHFVPYVDSRGTERWLSPEEYERRRHHKRKKRAIYEPIWGNAPRRTLLVLVALVGAVIVGWMIAR